MRFDPIKSVLRLKGAALLLSPFLISLLATLLIIVLFFPATSKYKITVNQVHKNEPFLATFEDINGDGTSDYIVFNNDTSNRYAILVTEYPSGQVNQWNFEGKLMDQSNGYLFVGDFDNNHRMELYIFSRSHDSIMLHCISNLRDNKPEFKNVFIAKMGSFDGHRQYDGLIVKAEMDDLNNDGYKELIFGVNTGFSITPRNIFTYDLHNKKLTTSPYLGVTIKRIVQEDITGDGKNEILIQGHGPDNITDTAIKHHDRSGWLMVLDRKLNFLFEPIEFKGAFTNIWPFVFKNPKKVNQAGFYLKSGMPPYNTALYLFSESGQLLTKKEIPELRPDGVTHAFTISKNGRSYVAFSETNKDEMLIIDQELKIVEVLRKIPTEYTEWIDIDHDGLKEMIALNMDQGKLLIMRNNLQDPVTIDFPSVAGYNPLISLKNKGKNAPELVVWDHSSLIFLSYSINPFYYLKWILYLGVYLSIFLFTIITRKIQRYQIEKKREVEKKITELQMKIVKNQLDPHFTLNAVNSIIYAVNNNEPQRATEHLYHFSSLYRHLLLTADQYTCSLKEELDFTVNYLKMEQLRHRDKFSYSLDVTDEVDTETEVPKMCIQTVVENAVKHGFSTYTAGGEIRITAVNRQHNLVIEVIDNGIGRAAAENNNHNSTKMGTKLTHEYFELFTKITKRKVALEVFDVEDDSGVAAGTKVSITIQLN